MRSRGQTGDDRIDQSRAKRQFVLWPLGSRQGAAHEAALALGAAEHHFGQHRLVELHQRDAGIEQVGQFLAQHAHDIVGDLLAVA